MYVLLTDESNLEAGESIKFFTYGGLIVPMENWPTLNQRIASIREQAGYAPSDRLKFDTNARPQGVSVEAATAAKREVVDAAIAANCTFIAYVVLHAIAKAHDVQTNIQFGANSVIAKFNSFLSEHESHGIVAMDRLPEGVQFNYLAEKFSNGLALPGGEAQKLNRILMFSSTCINASHASSVMDIVLGTWRYCINKPANEEAAKEMMQQLAKLVWHVPMGEQLIALEKGLLFRPKTVGVPAFRAEYQALLDQINALLKA